VAPEATDAAALVEAPGTEADVPPAEQPEGGEA
jgi:hypothetical protein